jgi:3-deoxy-manno-octulosonate cytidylyltransferase (CMP-KDO synthetase)
MQQLGDKTVILRTYQNVLATGLFDEVVVATDSDVIFKEITDNGGRAVMTRRDHQSGSDRIAEAASDMEADIVINVQGDEPFVDAESLKKLIDVFKDDHQKEISLASLMTQLSEYKEVENPSVVKVIVDLKNFALYFSRLPIPCDRDNELSPLYYKHIGIYAFRKQALIEFSEQEITPLESAEKIECIRYLEYGKKIKMVETLNLNFEIDTPDDLERAKVHLNQLNFE